MAYCGLKSRATFIPLTCNFAELQCWQKKKINWRIRITMLRLNVCIFSIHNGNVRSFHEGGHQR